MGSLLVRFLTDPRSPSRQMRLASTVFPRNTGELFRIFPMKFHRDVRTFIARGYQVGKNTSNIRFSASGPPPLALAALAGSTVNHGLEIECAMGSCFVMCAPGKQLRAQLVSATHCRTAWRFHLNLEAQLRFTYLEKSDHCETWWKCLLSPFEKCMSFALPL